MVSSCPVYNTNRNLESLCASRSSEADLFGMLPVSDLKNKIAYKNEFCARCNQATNLTYWKFSASCEGLSSHDIPTNRSLMLAFIMKECKWYFQPPSAKSDYLKLCLAIEQNCLDSELADEEPVLRDLCSFYAFPVCGDVHTKNPHCSICKGNAFSCKCKIPVSGAPGPQGPHGPPGSFGPPGSSGPPGPSGPYGPHRPPRPYGPAGPHGPQEPPGQHRPHGPAGQHGPPGIPPLNILFDFSSTSHSVQVGDTKTTVKNKVCAEGFVYDPFNEKCVQIHVFTAISEIALANASGSRDRSYINCSYVEMNISVVSLLSNGSIWIPLHKRIYNKEMYFINGSSVLLCADFKSVYAETETLLSMTRKMSPLQISTYIGYAISMISLISLLSIYIALPELRTLPGKNLISLSCAMLLYHVLFLLTGQTDKPNLCVAVSVLLHYFLLSSFCWMGVMAYDVAWTFGVKGN